MCLSFLSQTANRGTVFLITTPALLWSDGVVLTSAQRRNGNEMGCEVRGDGPVRQSGPVKSWLAVVVVKLECRQWNEV